MHEFSLNELHCSKSVPCPEQDCRTGVGTILTTHSNTCKWGELRHRVCQSLPSRRPHVRAAAPREGLCASITVSLVPGSYCPVPTLALGTSTAQQLESLPGSTCVSSLLCLCLDVSVAQLSSGDPWLLAGCLPVPIAAVGRWFLSNEAPCQGRLLTCSSIARWSPYLFSLHSLRNINDP